MPTAPDIDSPRTLAGLLTLAARRHAARPALVGDGVVMSYGELNDRVHWGVQRLRAAGLAPHDTIVCLFEPGPEAALAFLTAAAAARAAPLNPALPAQELSSQLQSLDARAVLLSRTAAAPLRRAALEAGLPVLELDTGAGDGSPTCTLSADPGAIALLLQTSGTTAQPKRVPLSQQNLCASARHIAQTLQLQAHDRSLSIMPLFHIHGLACLLAVIHSGGQCICPGNLRTDTLRHWLTAGGITWLSAAPTLLRAVLEAAAGTTHTLRFLRSCSAALPPTLMQELESAFGVPVVEAYGMTEAAHQMTSNPLPPGRRKPGSVGVPAGPCIAVLDEAGRELPTGATGEVAIQGVNVMSGYLDNPEANGAAFSGPYFRTGDSGHIDTDGYLWISGRLKEQINRGGEKIAPREIDEALLAHAAVAQAVAFATPHATLGEDVAAAVVLKAGAHCDEHELRAWLIRSLAPFKVPSRIVVLDEIPKGATGKVQRLGLAERLAAHLQVSFVPPASALEQAIADAMGEVLGRPVLGRDDNFFALGGDSLRAVRVLARLQQQLGHEIALALLFQTPTPRRLAVALEPQHVARQHGGLDASIPRDPAGAKRLSPAQRRLWFLQQLEPAAATAYQVNLALHWRGRLDTAALQRALDTLLARHEVLRMRVVIGEAGEPRPVIEPVSSGFSLAWHDLRPLAAGAKTRQLCALESKTIDTPFSHDARSLIRGTLVALEDRHHVLILAQHHLISDAWSRGLLARELTALYGSFAGARPEALPPLPVQYADYAAWQHASSPTPASLQYWRTYLAGAPALLALPTDRRRPAAQRYLGDCVPLRINAELTQRLTALAQRHQATLFMTLLAGFSVLLSRLSGQDDIVVGVPVAGRDRPELEALLGFFTNTLALRVRLDGDPTVTALLERVRVDTLAAMTHRNVAFSQVVEVLQPPRSLGHNPVFQAALAFDNTVHADPRPVAGMQVEQRALPTRAAKFDLALILREHGATLEGGLEYASDLFDRATIERWGTHLLELLSALAANAAGTVKALPMLAPAQRQQILRGFNATHLAQPDDCIHTLIEAQVARTPEAIAVVCGDEQLSYAALDARARCIAAALIADGVEPEDRIAVCLPRGLDMLAAVLGVLKAGGAYVPLDPDFPPLRLESMLIDSGPRLLLTHSTTRTRLPALAIPVVAVDGLAAPADASCAGRQVSPGHLAYLMYTSGSSGQPKAVMVEHRSVVNVLKSLACNPGLTADDVLLSVTTLSFDIAAVELFLPLITGARVILARRAEVLDPSTLQRLIVTHRVTAMQATPTGWSLLCAHGWQPPRNLKMLCGGEPLPAALAGTLVAGGRRLFNLYGPTETTIWSTGMQITSAPEEAIGSIGRPLANTQVYILDPRREPVAIGVPGEIYIGGAGVARGYWRRAQLSSERFVADPFSDIAGARLFRTGDVGRWHANGCIEFLGRSDFQIKLRGVRIEPGEIEAHLDNCAGVRRSLVLARELQPGDVRLVAYIEPEAATVNTSLLRERLSALLPPAMLPAAFVVLPAFPQTPNGKIDRQALPAPARSTEAATRPELPQTETERQIAAVWQEQLGVACVGRHDDFFALGGHSLLVLPVLAAIRARTGRPVLMAWLFRAPTCALLAASIDAAGETADGSHLTLLSEGVNRPPLFCLNGFEGDLVDYPHLVRYLDPEVPVYGLQVRAGDEAPDARMAAYEREIRRVQPHGPYRLCGYSFGGAEAFDLAGRLERNGEQVLLILLDTYRYSRAFRLRSALPRLLGQVRSGQLLQMLGRRGRGLIKELQRRFAGNRRDLKRSLLHHSRRRDYQPLTGRVVLFQSEGIEGWAYTPALDGYNGWRKLLMGPVDLVPVAARHAAMMREPAIREVADRVNAALS